MSSASTEETTPSLQLPPAQQRLVHGERMEEKSNNFQARSPFDSKSQLLPVSPNSPLSLKASSAPNADSNFLTLADAPLMASPRWLRLQTPGKGFRSHGGNSHSIKESSPVDLMLPGEVELSATTTTAAATASHRAPSAFSFQSVTPLTSRAVYAAASAALANSSAVPSSAPATHRSIARIGSLTQAENARVAYSEAVHRSHEREKKRREEQAANGGGINGTGGPLRSLASIAAQMNLSSPTSDGSGRVENLPLDKLLLRRDMLLRGEASAARDVDDTDEKHGGTGATSQRKNYLGRALVDGSYLKQYIKRSATAATGGGVGGGSNNANPIDTERGQWAYFKFILTPLNGGGATLSSSSGGLNSSSTSSSSGATSSSGSLGAYAQLLFPSVRIEIEAEDVGTQMQLLISTSEVYLSSLTERGCNWYNTLLSKEHDRYLNITVKGGNVANMTTGAHAPNPHAHLHHQHHNNTSTDKDKVQAEKLGVKSSRKRKHHHASMTAPHGFTTSHAVNIPHYNHGEMPRFIKEASLTSMEQSLLRGESIVLYISVFATGHYRIRAQSFVNSSGVGSAAHNAHKERQKELAMMHAAHKYRDRSAPSSLLRQQNNNNSNNNSGNGGSNNEADELLPPGLQQLRDLKLHSAHASNARNGLIARLAALQSDPLQMEAFQKSVEKIKEERRNRREQGLAKPAGLVALVPPAILLSPSEEGYEASSSSERRIARASNSIHSNKMLVRSQAKGLKQRHAQWVEKHEGRFENVAQNRLADQVRREEAQKTLVAELQAKADRIEAARHEAALQEEAKAHAVWEAQQHSQEMAKAAAAQRAAEEEERLAAYGALLQARANARRERTIQEDNARAAAEEQAYQIRKAAAEQAALEAAKLRIEEEKAIHGGRMGNLVSHGTASTSSAGSSIYSRPRGTSFSSLHNFHHADSPLSPSAASAAAAAAANTNSQEYRDPYAMPSHHSHAFSAAALHEQSLLHANSTLVDSSHSFNHLSRKPSFATTNSAVGNGGLQLESEAEVVERLKAQLVSGLADDQHTFLRAAMSTAQQQSAREAAAREAKLREMERERDAAERERDAIARGISRSGHRRKLSILQASGQTNSPLMSPTAAASSPRLESRSSENQTPRGSVSASSHTLSPTLSAASSPPSAMMESVAEMPKLDLPGPAGEVPFSLPAAAFASASASSSAKSTTIPTPRRSFVVTPSVS